MRLVAVGSAFVSELPHPALFDVDELVAYLLYAGDYRREWCVRAGIELWATEEALAEASRLLERDLQFQAGWGLRNR